MGRKQNRNMVELNTIAVIRIRFPFEKYQGEKHGANHSIGTPSWAKNNSAKWFFMAFLLHNSLQSAGNSHKSPGFP
jgi:hypothetical protein